MYFKTQLYVENTCHWKPLLILPYAPSKPENEHMTEINNFWYRWDSNPQLLNQQKSVLPLDYYRSLVPFYDKCFNLIFTNNVSCLIIFENERKSYPYTVMEMGAIFRTILQFWNGVKLYFLVLICKMFYFYKSVHLKINCTC